MNSKKSATVFVLLSLVLLTSFVSIETMRISGFSDNTSPGGPVFRTEANSLNFSKLIQFRDGSYQEGPFQTYVNRTNTVRLQLENIDPVETLFNVSVSSPEINVTEMNPVYETDWFNFTGDLEQNYSSILVGQTVSFEYQVKIRVARAITFGRSNVTFAYANGTKDYFLSNQIVFDVFELPEQLVTEKRFSVGGDDVTSTRVKFNETVTVKVTVTNYFYDACNITAQDFVYTNNSKFDFDETEINATYEYLQPNDSFSFTYTLKPIVPENETYALLACQVTGTFQNGTERQDTSNSITLEVYAPVYDGDDIKKLVPLVSVTKYILYGEQKLQKITMYNDSIEPLIIQINVTNHGEVIAYNVTIVEEAYREWVFETVNLEEWTIASLRANESRLFNYTITAQIVGSFQFQSTEVTFDFISPKTLLSVRDHVAYSNLLEITIEQRIVRPAKNVQWWTTIGISFGIVALGAITTIVTFVTYKNRRRYQKGT